MAEQPAEDVVGSWQVCSPASVKGFSAVEYFFGRHLQQNLHVPMGLIESDWGGTPAQSWTVEGGHCERSGAEIRAGRVWDTRADELSGGERAYDAAVAAWEKTAAEAKAAGKTPRRRVLGCLQGRAIRILRRDCTTA